MAPPETTTIPGPVRSASTFSPRLAARRVRMNLHPPRPPFGIRMVASMKVLHIVKTAVGANWAYEQVRVLCSLGIEVVVALPCDTAGLAPKYREAGAAVVRANLDLPAREPWRIPATLRACRHLVADVRPDVIHTHHVGTTFIARLALGKNSPIPRVFGVTGTLHLEHGFFAWLDTHLAGPPGYLIAALLRATAPS